MIKQLLDSKPMQLFVRLLPLPFLLSTHHNKDSNLSGDINASLFAYITPLMLSVLTIIYVIIVFHYQTLKIYFMTNVALNGLIIFMILLSLVQAFNNNYQLFKTARFMRDIERCIDAEEVTEQEVAKLNKRLEHEIPLLNTKQMHDNIKNLAEFGHPNFSDNDARIIKSKLGFRIRLRSSDVNFNTGILVMLGLLGTFLGLLKTIDSVGNVMASMSDMGGDGGDVDMDAMTGFIGALSAPLQGMSLAFSTSLFGLSGSLLIGYFNHICGGSQDTFMEASSRWIDDRIPHFDPKKKKGAAGNRAASQNDLRTWLAGFVYMSVKTNKQIGRLVYTTLHSLKETTASNKYLDRIAISQEHMSQRLHESTSNVDRLAGQGKIITDNVTHVTKVVHNMHAVSNNNMSEIKNNIGQMATAVTGMSHVIKEQAASSSNYESHLIRVEKLLEQLVQSQQQMITDLKVMGSTGAGAASGSLSAQISDVGDMNNDISTMLKEIENADEDNFNKIFGFDEDAEE